MNKILKFATIFLILSLIGGVIFFVFRFKSTKNKAEELENRTKILSEEKADIMRQKLSEEKLVMALKIELAGLSDVKNIKEQYNVNRKKLKVLDETYSKAKKETNVLKQSNLSLNSRVNSLTREFTKTLEILKNVKKELNSAKSDKTIRSYLAKIDNTSKLLKEKDSEIKELVKASSNSKKDNKTLEKKIINLEKEKNKVEKRLEKALSVSAKSPNDRLKSQVSDLRKQLKVKESQRRLLNSEVVRLASSRTKINEKLNYQSEKIANLEEELLDIQRKTRNIKRIESERDLAEEDLADARRKLKAQEKIITLLKGGPSNEILTSFGELPFHTGEMDGDLNKAYALYDTAKAQVVKFSELLMSKEVELETSRLRISQLEKALQYGSGSSLPPGATEARQYALLKDRIKMLNESLVAKERALKSKDEELAALSMAKETLEERDHYQDKEFKNANMLYSNLKNQMLQITELLSRREEELIAKNKDVLSLKSELAILRAEFKVKQQELRDMQLRQRRTMEDLSRSTQLNITLQENMVGQFKKPATESDDKRKADKLKREIELLMGN